MMINKQKKEEKEEEEISFPAKEESLSSSSFFPLSSRTHLVFPFPHEKKEDG